MPSPPSESDRISLLLVDDDTELLEDMQQYFHHQQYDVATASDAERALELSDRRAFDLIILDQMMPGTSGIELLENLKKRGNEAEVVMLTGEGTIQSAVEAMKLGAREFLTKPIRLGELDRLVRKAVQAGHLRRENEQLKVLLQKHQRSPDIVGQSPVMDAVRRLIDRTARTDKPILIQGESGTGKELVARAIHQASQLASRPLVVINCAALPETLLESELFGYEKGAFTGAVSSKPGLFEVADGGTLFIDEIGELAPALQAKLLRVLEDGTLRRLGSVKERRVRVRLLAATNRDLIHEVNERRFREDLFYRINVLTIELPPLRERTGDVDLLTRHFVGPRWQLADNFLPTLRRYSWPGNVRQLQNAIERAKILAEAELLEVDNLPAEVARLADELSTPANVDLAECDLETLNRLHIAETYRRHDRNKARTARALGIGRRTLYRLLEKYGIESAADQPIPADQDSAASIDLADGSDI